MKLHVLTGNADNQYSVVVHVATPVGNNSAGVAWSAIAASLNPVSVLTIGAGPGQIAQTEVDQIVAGTLLEASFAYWDDITLTPAQRLVALDAVGTVMSANLLSQYQTKYKYFGLTRT